MKTITDYLKKIGSLGGNASTAAKAEAARINGSKGGRPKKPTAIQGLLVDAADEHILAEHYWQVGKHGYVFRTYGPKKARKWQYLHRLLTGEPDCLIDHIDGNKLNNRRSNLRRADRSLNGLNTTRPGKRNTTGTVGVARNGNGWRARINVDGVAVELGTHKTKDEAAKAVTEFRKQIITKKEVQHST